MMVWQPMGQPDHGTWAGAEVNESRIDIDNCGSGYNAYSSDRGSATARS